MLAINNTQESYRVNLYVMRLLQVALNTFEGNLFLEGFEIKHPHIVHLIMFTSEVSCTT
mgnify:CR=1 FL=1